MTVTGTGRAPLETRCILDPQTPPTSFGDLPPACSFASGARVGRLGTHAVYAASRDGSGVVTPVMVRRAFSLSKVPETTIESGASGLTWRPDNLFYFSSNVNPAKFECWVDLSEDRWVHDSAFACSSPYETGTLSQTNHIFAVRAIAPGGAVDPTPAYRSFRVAKPVDIRTGCMNHSPLSDDRIGCFIGTLGRNACLAVLGVNCVVRHQICGLGARCTITTKTSWVDADTGIPWGANAGAGLGNRDSAVAFHSTGDVWKWCWTTAYYHSCFVRATLQVLGDGRPLWSSCNGDGPLPDHYQSGLSVYRRLLCEADWHVVPAPELAAVPASQTPGGETVQVSILSPGILSVLFTILGTINADRLEASARPQAASPRPQITPVRKAVSRAGPVTIPLKLNTAAKQLLKQKKKLTISLRLSFTRKGGRKVTRTQPVTITAPRICPQQPKNPATKLPGCLARQ